MGDSRVCDVAQVNTHPDTPRDHPSGPHTGDTAAYWAFIAGRREHGTRWGNVLSRVDCDVLQADGGTRAAAITGAYVALYHALASIRESGDPDDMQVESGVAAVSVGVVNGEAILDLCYEEDHRAEVDFNVVMTDTGEFIEVQGTAENGAFSRARLDELMSLAEIGIARLAEIQRETIADMTG